MLHSAFWRHGAGDLEHLPTWCFATIQALFEADNTIDHGNATAASTSSQTSPSFLLDSSYPRKIKTYLKGLAAYDLRALDLHIISSEVASTVRSFASTARDRDTSEYGALSSSSGSADTTFAASPPAPALEDQEAALSTLLGYLEANERGEYQDTWVRAWRLYSQLGPARRTSSIIARFMKFLSKSPRALDADRILRLFVEVPAIDQQPSMYVDAIEANLKLGFTGKAFRLGEVGLVAFPASIATPILFTLMSNAIANSRWQLAFHIWDLRSRSAVGLTRTPDADFSFFRRLKRIPHFRLRVKTLMSTLRRFPDILTTTGSQAFVLGLVTSIFHRKDGPTFGSRQNFEALALLKNLGVDITSLYEVAVARTVRTISRGSSIQERVGHAFALYKLARVQAGFVPSLEMMRTLLKGANDAGNTELIRALFSDWPRFHGVPLIRDTTLFMFYFAKLGDSAALNLALDNYTKAHRQYTARLFHPRLHLYALQADSKSIEHFMFTEMPKYSVEPDIFCWNILLHAFQRAEDLKGAMECVSKLVKTGLKPDDYTFGTVMSIAADRGDLDLIGQLQQAARAYGITDTQVMNDCYVQALLRNHAADAAENFARSITKKRPSDKTRMWNQILTFHTHDAANRESFKIALRLARDMQQLGVPFDSLTFSAIIRAYTLRGKPAVAKRILQKIMPRRNIPASAFHYALVIHGYVERGSLALALEVEKDMLMAGVKPDFSVRLALQKLHIKAAHGSVMSFQDDVAAGERIAELDLSKELIDESSQHHADLSSKSPRLSEQRYGVLDTQPGAYFDLLLSMYGRAKAFDMVKALIEEYDEQSKARPVELRRTPLGVIVSLLNLRYHQRDHAEVLRYWTLARTTAVAKYVSATTSTRTKGRVPVGRRTCLARHLDVYMRSSAGQGNHTSILETIQELFDLGFALDNRNWNLYVQLIATEGLYLEAFSICERRLMSNFPGWRPGPRSRKSEQGETGMMFQPVWSQVLRFGELRVDHRTMVRLAHVVRKLRQQAPFLVKSQSTLDELQRKAPKTFKAVMELPVREHPTVTHVLGNPSRVKGDRRTLPEG